MTQPMPGSVLPFVATLRELFKPPERVRPGERCELCDAVLSPEHGHVVNTRTRRLLCVCRTCGTPRDLAYRAVPTRYVRLPRMTVSAADWEAFGIPVDLAFFFFNSDLDRIVACYPGPAGAVESLLPLDAWSAIVGRNPPIQSLVADVEALLVRRADDEYATFIVPIDVCYELVGRIRQAWTGFRGGGAGQRAVDELFATVLEKTADASASVTSGAHLRGQEPT